MKIGPIRYECQVCGDSYYCYDPVEKKMRRCFAHVGVTSWSFADDCKTNIDTFEEEA